MNNRAMTLSLILAAMGVFFVQSYVSSVEEDAARKYGSKILVASAKKDIGEMQAIDETMFELTGVPQKFLEPAAISFPYDGEKSEKNAVKELGAIVGSIARVPIKKGEQLTYNKLSEPSIRTGLSQQVTPGRRAVSVPVDEIAGVSKLVKPGDRVDVIGVIGEGVRERISRTLLQDVAVIAVGRSVTNNLPLALEFDAATRKQKLRSLASFDGYSSVTLEVDPAQAQMLSLVMTHAKNKIILVLRNNDDTDRVDPGGSVIEDVLGTDDRARLRGSEQVGGLKR